MSGRATAGGIGFQAEVGAYAAGLLLAERPLSRFSVGLPGKLQKVSFETAAHVDDLTIDTDIGKVFIQAKRTINLSSKAASELASVAAQFVQQYRAGIERFWLAGWKYSETGSEAAIRLTGTSGFKSQPRILERPDWGREADVANNWRTLNGDVRFYLRKSSIKKLMRFHIDHRIDKGAACNFSSNGVTRS